ncbi:MAG: hypothetical protein OIF56_13730 [Cohaesibacter sp.]|nr:hypothetical protein [Cohaesibacter sp.]
MTSFITKEGKYDRAAIMKAAWDGIPRNATMRRRLALRLSIIWAEAKAEMKAMEQTAKQNAADKLEAKAMIIEMKTRFTGADMARANDLRKQARQLAA